MRKVTNDGIAGYSNCLASDGIVHKIRANQREITMRNNRGKDLAKLQAKCLPHVDTYLDTLRLIEV